jgi:hypothetical protein
VSPSCEVEHASLGCSGDVQIPKTLVVEFDLLMNKIASVLYHRHVVNFIKFIFVGITLFQLNNYDGGLD